MRNVVCPHCRQEGAVPADLARAHCVRCGQAFGLTDTNITADETPPSLPAGPRDAFAEREVAESATVRTLPEHWSSWEEFRANSPAVQREMMQLVGRPLPDLRAMKVLPLPEDLPAEMDRWGRPLGTIQIPGDSGGPLTRYLVSCFFFFGGLALLAIGVLLFIFDDDPRKASSEVVIGYGVFGVFVGGLVAWFGPAAPKFPATLWIFEEGVYLSCYGRSKVSPWAEIQDFEASMATGRPLYWLTLAHDLSVAISVNFSPEVVPLMEYVEMRLSATQFMRRVEAIWDGRPQHFGVVTLDRIGFKGPDCFVPWAEVRRVVSDAQNLFVDWSRSADWVPVRYRDVSFPYLVMAISHVLIEEHQRFPRVDA
jgi:hypothetical protein